MTPDDYTIREFYIEVGDGHELYVHDWGNKKAKHPIIFLHGGPGSGTKDKHKIQFDPTQQRVIFFDQRGCGKSLPFGSLKHNTTEKIIEDIDKIAKELKISSFVLTGGSWGSCLALAYAVKHPQKVLAMVLSGVFTGSQAEIDYFDKGQFKAWFPEVWERYLAATPNEHRHSPTTYHFQQILGKNDETACRSACAYGNMEGALLQLDDRFSPAAADNPEYDPTDIKIEVHYLANRCFMPDRYIFDSARKLTMPVWLVQGRYDMVCPPTTAYELHQKLPKSQLIWTVGGHRSSEREAQSVLRSILLHFGGEK
ncbi:MAG TPA: alpha/beta fold hydrolase [Candidatus Saccharimonadales bacterium]|nr:alpha/beta fold hydrolase [Candidatus Saccharimonadales bacterium]